MGCLDRQASSFAPNGNYHRPTLRLTAAMHRVILDFFWVTTAGLGGLMVGDASNILGSYRVPIPYVCHII